ncbi:carbohydrate-binding module family 14 protein [Thalassovita mangrovi]|uniref:Adenylosuccinate lyase n=1 Tax=Thalassovita mangrovi TaxID=2692236 RepID=A0A6L8LES3_9RHOB|nr:carbohydrate-binding module family 14 protein [Thalassovita mangrovi]MYM54193.1 adenylosuccinate lyase [Thalassovita mangrovi]
MIKTILTAVILTAAPLAASAQCTKDHQQAMSCADGTVWDAETKSCTKVTG